MHENFIIQKEIVVLRDKINFVLNCRICNSLSEFTRENEISFVEKNLKYSALSWKISQPFRDRISRGAYRTIDFSIANAAKRRNIIGIPSIIPIVFPLITGKLNIERYSYTQYIRECMRYSFYFPTFDQSEYVKKI